SNRYFVVINDDEIVDPMGIEQFENLDCELVFMDSDRVQGHQVRHQTFAHFRVGLKMPREIAVWETPEWWAVSARHYGCASAHAGHGFEHVAHGRGRRNDRH